MGKSMLTAFYDAIDLSGHAVVEVELPLSARLYTDDGLPTEFMLVGIIDLLLMNENNDAVVVDCKTAAQPMAQDDADTNLQMSSYSYLLAANKYVFPTSPVQCRFDVLRKLKTPKFEQVHTVRTAQDRKRFAKIANAVLNGIDAGIYMPQPNWMCADCSHADACRDW
jgi:putative RecB family exonuclease